MYPQNHWEQVASKLLLFTSSVVSPLPQGFVPSPSSLGHNLGHFNWAEAGPGALKGRKILWDPIIFCAMCHLFCDVDAQGKRPLVAFLLPAKCPDDNLEIEKNEVERRGDKRTSITSDEAPVLLSSRETQTALCEENLCLCSYKQPRFSPLILQLHKSLKAEEQRAELL